ncbi:MAG TPA: SLBB domain-containing protein [Spirochaetia bacterium]|nr:SLBB domain-containing protein [Spirochaetia bacterium]
MKISSIALCLLIALSAPAAFADNSPAAPQSPTGFGLQPTIFNSVRQASTNLQNNLTNLTSYTPTPGDLYTLTVDSGSTGVVGTSSLVSYPVPLNDNMTMDVPYIGTINVKGKTLPEIRQEVVTGVKRAVPVVYVNFVLSTPAEFNVFVYGGVNSPGYIVANPLVTVIDAVGMAKGFVNGASYRSIDLIRDGKSIVLDLSKYYLDADMNANPHLKPGDKIYVPEAKVVATITGQVQYPGTYELLPTESLATLINLAGGPAPGALTNGIQVTRVMTDGAHRVYTVPISDAASFKMSYGDNVAVLSSLENSNVVSVQGAVFGKPRSGEGPVTVPTTPVRVDFPYYPGMTLLSILDSVGGPTPYALTGNGYIVQHSTGKRIPVQIAQLWKTRDSSLNVDLHAGDQVVIPIQILQVFVTGQVAKPGPVPYQPDATVNDYLLLAGGVIQNVGDPNGVYLVAPNGAKTKLSSGEEVAPGSNISVSMTRLFQTNQSVNNFLLTTGWIAAIISFGTALWNFLVLVGVL